MERILIVLIVYAIYMTTIIAGPVDNSTEITDLIGRVEALEEAFSTIGRVQNEAETVLLHITLSKNMQDVSKHVTIIFDNPVIDTGNHYNENDGIFISPFSGTILVYWTIATDETAKTELMVEDRVVGTLLTSASSVTTNSRYGHSSTTMKQSSSSTVAVTEVQKGDHIFLRTASHDNHILAISSSLVIRNLT